MVVGDSSVTERSGSSPEIDRRFRFKSWNWQAIQVQVLKLTGDSGLNSENFDADDFLWLSIT